MITPMSDRAPPLENWPNFDGPRPEFGKPPVIEVVLSAQFTSLDLLVTPHFGLIWGLFRDELEETEEQPPLGQVYEKFEFGQKQRAHIRIETVPSPTRHWFKTADGSQLVQIQRDRFIYNWRRFNWDEPYPRYGFVRDQFLHYFQQFAGFVDSNELGPIVPDQCEVTYLNHIFVDEAVSSLGAMEEIFAPWSGERSDTFLGAPEEVQLQLRFPILDTKGQPICRLHVSAEPRLRVEDSAPLIRINLTARGAPPTKDLDGILTFFDLGRECVVRGFTSITSKAMHKIWERVDV